MQIGSLFTLRRAFVMGAVAILTMLVASLAPAQAIDVPPDGGIDSPVGQEWFHSTVAPAESPAGSDAVTDGWLHSLPAIQDSSAYALTDGWLHSSPTIQDSSAYALTDGWLHSRPVIQDSTAYAVTDGWLHSSVMESLPKPDGAGTTVAESRPLTDGWLHSVIAESARSTGPRTPVASTSRGFPTEIAIASSILTLVLAAGGVMLLRRRHTSITA